MASLTEPRVRVLVDREVRWMTLDAARVMHNYLAIKRHHPNAWPADGCSKGHPFIKGNFREYHYGGYIHRTCMICARDRATANYKRKKNGNTNSTRDQGD